MPAAGLAEGPGIAGAAAIARLVGDDIGDRLGLAGAGREGDGAGALQEHAGADGGAGGAIAAAAEARAAEAGGDGIAVDGERDRRP